MSDPSAPKPKRNVPVGEMVAVGGLVISALALWNSWRADDPASKSAAAAPATVPLALRGTIEDDGKAIRLAPVEPGHALETLTVTAPAPADGTASYGSEPILAAATLEDWLPETVERKGTGALTLNVDARYIERGEIRTARQRYRVSYRWADGGLLGGRSLRLTGFRRG